MLSSSSRHGPFYSSSSYDYHYVPSYYCVFCFVIRLCLILMGLQRRHARLELSHALREASFKSRVLDLELPSRWLLRGHEDLDVLTDEGLHGQLDRYSRAGSASIKKFS